MSERRPDLLYVVDTLDGPALIGACGETVPPDWRETLGAHLRAGGVAVHLHSKVDAATLQRCARDHLLPPDATHVRALTRLDLPLTPGSPVLQDAVAALDAALTSGDPP